jgi:hypothetical protein
MKAVRSSGSEYGCPKSRRNDGSVARQRTPAARPVRAYVLIEASGTVSRRAKADPPLESTHPGSNRLLPDLQVGRLLDAAASLECDRDADLGLGEPEQLVAW